MGPYKTASIAASPLLRPRHVNQKPAKIYYIKCKSIAAKEETAAIEETAAAIEELFYCGAAIEEPQQKTVHIFYFFSIVAFSIAAITYEFGLDRSPQ